MNYFYLILISVLLSSCSSSKKVRAPRIATGTTEYSYQDNSGKYKLKREVKSNKNKVIVIESLFDKSGKLTQKEIFVSQRGMLRKELPILRPYTSQFHVWFSGKKYVSQLNLNVKTKQYDLVTTEGLKKSFDVPKGNGGFCFLGQIIECAELSGFISKSIEYKRGAFNFILVLNGHPYWQQIYSGVKSEVMVPASLVYEGEVSGGKSHRFGLEFEGQNLTFVIGANGKLTQKFWIAESMSMVEKRGRILSEEELVN